MVSLSTVGWVAVAGCSSSARSSVDTPGASATEDADGRIAHRARELELGVLVMLQDARESHRSLRQVLAEAEQVHREHVRLLDRAAGSSRTSLPSSAATLVPEEALRRVVRAEQRLSEQHATSAVVTASGPFARVLAGMAAAAAQQSAALADAVAEVVARATPRPDAGSTR